MQNYTLALDIIYSQHSANNVTASHHPVYCENHCSLTSLCYHHLLGQYLTIIFSEFVFFMCLSPECCLKASFYGCLYLIFLSSC